MIYFLGFTTLLFLAASLLFYMFWQMEKESRIWKNYEDSYQENKNDVLQSENERLHKETKALKAEIKWLTGSKQEVK